jgi:polar amino acid transport system substrate-binding protein
VNARRSPLAALAISSVILAACGAGSGTSAAASASARDATIPPPTSLATAGQLVDCVDIEYPPLEYFPSTDVTDPNAAIGFDVDAAREAAATMGLQITIRNVPFDALIPDLAAGRCDIVWSALFISDERLEVADAVPYMMTGDGVLVAVGNPAGLHSLEDLCGKTIAIQTGGVVENASAAASQACTDAGQPAIDIQGYERTADVFQQIALGRVDGVWDVQEGMANWMSTHPDEYEVAFMASQDQIYGIYYGKGKTDIGEAFAAALRELKEDGTLAGIAESYNLDPATLDAID